MNRSAWARLGAGMALVVTVGACTAGPTTEPEAVPSRYVEPPAISAAAQQRFGKKPAEQAYREMARFVTDQWIDGRLLDPQRTNPPTDAELSAGIVQRLTPTTQAYWHELVAKARAGDKNAVEDVKLMRYYGIDAPTLTLPTGGPAAESQTTTNGQVDVGKPRPDGLIPLRIAVHQEARIPLLSARRPYPALLAKDLTLEVLPAEQVTRLATEPPAADGTGTTTPTPAVTIDPKATWLISTFDGELQVSFPRADEAPPPSATPQGT